MMENFNHQDTRKVFFEAWQKELHSQPVTPLEGIIVDVLKRHPEYQSIFSHQEAFENFQINLKNGGVNPFFHLSLHVAILEQVNANRPNGIKEIFVRLHNKYHDQTEVEHKMMEVLAQLLHDAAHKPEFLADDSEYLERLKRLFR
ncbi:DUF1841 family protein [Candidatus Berkiella cookevillensis]|uniref:DUF1841 family protein n=2 Tax=Candidatus Berkiella cookevillensis TaxID=437022 RepID=A0AAE3L6I4_9GAMM|nr:DUF1841 family protein [Candidatus Berkiella cookevillensis]MCS5708840.1 DUF1841 family protein [Candidatus Berkiella cookevillensis]